MITENGREYFPLSLNQQNILALERTLSGTSVNNISTTVKIKGRLDFAVLTKVINAIIEKDSTLRTRITSATDGATVQYCVPYTYEDFPVYDFTNTSTEGIENWEMAVTRETIFIEDSPLYRFILFRDSETSGGILVKLHHIIADGWSQIMLCNKIGKLYLDALSNIDVEIDMSPNYKLHIEEEQEYLKSPSFSKDERYWKGIVESIGEPSSLKNISGASVSPVGKRLSFNLPQIINHAIFSYCQEKRVAPFAVFYMALAIYFKRNGGDKRFTVGVPIVNRTNYIFKQSTGMFVSTLPFYNEINDEWSLNEFNDDLTEKWYDLLRHQRYPFSKIAELSGSENRLFNIALSYQDSKIFESRDASVHLSGRWHYCGYQAEQLTIHLTNLKNHQQYAVDYDYLAQFFTEEDITSLHRSICRILAEALDCPDAPLYRLNVLSLEDKEKVLYTFNNTDRYLEETSIFDSLLKNSKNYLNRVAVINKGERTTYGALLHKSAQYAELLSPYVSGNDNALVAIYLPRSVELFAAMVGTLQQECAYMLISSSLPLERIKTILEQSKAALLITDENGKRELKDLSIPVLTANEANDCYGIPSKRESSDDSVVGDKLAYVVYTSGSTGEPKGVEITQRNLLNFSQEMTDVYGRGAVLSLCNIGFDAFMLESIVALLNGRTVVLPDDMDLESAERLASLINGYAVSFISLTPSRLSAFLRVDAFKNVMWKMESIVCGGESFPHELLKKLKECSLARIYNQYGPSEATVAVSMKELSGADKITVGSPLGNCKLYVLDEHMNPLPIGGNGKLFVGGKSVGRGYRNRPDLTEAAFKSNPFVHDDTIYDTGDLAHWTPSGEIVLSGRADRQIKLRGLRIELQEISSCIESYPDISVAHAAVRTVNSQQVLGVYYISDRTISDIDLLSYAATYLPGYMIPSFFVKLDEFPFTANGKIDENALPIPDINNSADRVTQAGERVLEIFKEILHTENISASTDYFLAGGNSLNAMEALIEIEKSFGRRLRVADLYVYRTAAKLGAFLDGVSCHASTNKETETVVIKKSPIQDTYPLTPVQQGMYVQTILSPDGLVYNMPGAFRMAEKVDVDLLESAFKSMIAEDPIFRTEFVSENGEIVARVCDSVSFGIERLTGESIDAVSGRFFRPFDLSKAPLIRAGIWTSENGDDVLFFDCHHIIGDGFSTSIILRRLDRLMSGKKSDVNLNFYDFVAGTESVKNKGDLEFWVHTLENLPEQVILPADKERPARFDYLGDELILSFTEAESRKIGEFCRESGDTEYGLFLGAFALVISCLSGKNDIIIGAPVSGRYLKDTDSICGPFINTLPLRLRRSEDMTVGQWLDHARLAVTGMLDHQSTGLEDIISALKLPRGESNALYRIMLTQTPVKNSDLTIGNNKMTYLPITTGNVKMDLILELSGDTNGYSMRFSYATGLFERETVALWSRYVKEAVLAFIKSDEAKLDNLDLLSSEDREKLVDDINYYVTPFVNRPIHSQLKATASKRSSECAVIFHENRYTFADLEQRASFIANHLRSIGVNSGTVAICMQRGFEMIATMYGVLKAGCAYTFLQESLPEARLVYMLEASEARCLVKDDFVSVSDNLTNGLDCPIVRVPDGMSTDDHADATASEVANILFTSGSTGRPKGVMLKHRSLANLLGQMKTLLEDVPGNVLCSTNCIFDCFVVETLIALALGRCVVMADEEEMLLPWKLAQLIEKYETSVFEMTPSRFRMCLGNDEFRRVAHHIGIVLLGGEVVSRSLVDDFYSCSSGRLMNMYGPTEATVFTTMCHLLPNEFVTIGRPLQNTRTYVLDEKLSPVLPTACGEMYIAGECLAQGYASSPDQTEAAFVSDIVFEGERMYKTGDIVRLRADGRYDYIGRVDDQIKLNGQRVEISEINGAILATAKALHAATVGVKNNDGSMSLCSFFVPVDNASPADITEEIKKLLPKYMVPSRLISLDKMPMTATNKIDMMSLKELAEKEAFSNDEIENSDNKEDIIENHENPVVKDEEPEQHNDLCMMCAEKKIDADYVISVWNKVLKSSISDTNASFFDCGGTSLAALSVLSFYYNDKLEMSISDFYNNPTVHEQVVFLNSGSSDLDHSNDVISEESADVSEIISNEPETVSNRRDILVTGATGFFGAHLVYEIISKDPDAHVLCLMRDGSEARLRERLAWYFSGVVADKLLQNIEVICGDISKKCLGLSNDEIDALASRIGEIYHCAADVRHYSSDEKNYLNINVGGTREMIELARKSNSRLYHMSTCSVSGSELNNGKTAEFTEKEFDIGQEWQKNIYVRSKFLAEKAVFEAIRSGVDAVIFRLGRLVGREADGKFQYNPESNMFYLIMNAAESLGVLPNVMAGVKWDFMPVDMAAEQVVLLKQTDGRVFHIMNQDPPSLGELFCAISNKHRIVPVESFIELYSKKESSINRIYSTLIRMHFLSPYNEPKIKVTCSITADALEKLGYSRKIRSLEVALSDFRKGK